MDQTHDSEPDPGTTIREPLYDVLDPDFDHFEFEPDPRWLDPE
jgi:hypothetical protein